MLARCHQALARGAPLVVLSETSAASEAGEAPALDLVAGRPLHEATWELLLDRTGFVEVAPLAHTAGGDGRFAVCATAPR